MFAHSKARDGSEWAFRWFTGMSGNPHSRRDVTRLVCGRRNYDDLLVDGS
jgi:hypothetical protein